MRPCAAIATLSTLVFYSSAGAQDIPAPTADMLPTPEEIRKAPCFPFFDASDPNARHYQLPAELEVKDVSRPGERAFAVVDGRPSDPGGFFRIPPCSFRERKIIFIESALMAPRFDHKNAVFHRSLEIQLYRFADPLHVAKNMETMRAADRERGRLGDTLAIGDDAYVGKWNKTGSGKVAIHVGKGTFLIRIESSGVMALYQEKLKALMTYAAELTVAKVAPHSGGTAPPVTPPPPPPPEIEIVAGPGGKPETVAPGGAVQCTVRAKHRAGGALNYHWSATSGSFNDADSQTPIWTAPPKALTTSVKITVAVTAVDGTGTSASYKQQVGAIADLRIEPRWIVLSYSMNNSFMQIEAAADQQCVAVMVQNDHPVATAKGVMIQLSAGPQSGDGVAIGDPVAVGDLPPGGRKAVSAIWDLHGQNVEGHRLFAHAYCENTGDANPDNNFASVDIDGIYYAHNGTRAFSFKDDTFSFKNYGLEDRGLRALVDQQAALLAGCIDRKQPKAPLINDPFFMVSYLRYKEYMKQFADLHIGGVCHGFVHAAIEHFEKPDTRPVAKDVAAMSITEAGATIGIYHTTQLRRLSPAMLTGKIYAPADYHVTRSLVTAEGALKNQRQCVYVALAGFEEKKGGSKVGGWGHAILGYKLIKVAGRAPVLYVYDPNLPANSPRVAGRRCMTQIRFAGKAFRMPDSMNQIYHQAAYRKDGTRSRTYDNGIAVTARLRELSDTEVKATALAANSSVYAMATWMQSNGLAGHVLRCPADAYFTDLLGLRTGVIGGKVVNEIPSAEVRSSGDVEIYFLPVGGKYQVVIEGTANGEARLASIQGVNNTRIGVTAFEGIPLRPGNRTVGTVLPGGRIDALVADGAHIKPSVGGSLNRDDPAWGEARTAGTNPAAAIPLQEWIQTRPWFARLAKKMPKGVTLSAELAAPQEVGWELVGIRAHHSPTSSFDPNISPTIAQFRVSADRQVIEFFEPVSAKHAPLKVFLETWGLNER